MYKVSLHVDNLVQEEDSKEKEYFK